MMNPYLQLLLILLAQIGLLLSESSAQAKLWVPGIICSENPEFGGTIHPNGKTFWFNRTPPDRSKIILLESKLEAGKWSKPTTPGFADTLFREIDPCISPNGQQLIFTSNRPLPDSNTKDYNLWWVKPGEKTANPFPEAINTGSDEIYAGLSRKGNLYFARVLRNKAKLFWAPLHEGGYSRVEQINLPGIDTASLSNPAISPDERFLVFASGQLGGLGSADLFVAKRMPDGSWSKPQNMGASINSREAEFAPVFSANGKMLFFTSERPGMVQEFPEGKRRPGDIYSIPFTRVIKALFK